MYQDIKFEQITEEEKKNTIFIDVRSEGEFEESHIPGAVNIPIFTNRERAEVGTVYKQVGKQDAKDLGLHIASAKLPQLVEDVQKAAKGKQPVVYCWRGGMRSKSVATILDLMGISVLRLDGGYRAYRESVKQELMNYKLDARIVVIHGMTGVGKTKLLKQMEAEGLPVIDLEGLAGHKGSAFGSIGEVPRNQRTFDSLLLERLHELKGTPYVIIEAESKRVGRINVQDFLLNGKDTGLQILLEAPMSIRVERTLEQYVVDDPEFKEKVIGALKAIEKKLSPEDRELGWEAIEQEDYGKLVEMLLIKYYDPRYQHSLEQYKGPFITLSAEDLDKCKEEVTQVIYQSLSNSEE